MEDLGSIPGWGSSLGEELSYLLQYSWAFLMAQTVKNLPAMQKTWVRSLGLGNPLERGTPGFWAKEFQGLFHGVSKSQTQLSDFHLHTQYEEQQGFSWADDLFSSREHCSSPY